MKPTTLHSQASKDLIIGLLALALTIIIWALLMAPVAV